MALELGRFVGEPTGHPGYAFLGSEVAQLLHVCDRGFLLGKLHRTHCSLLLRIWLRNEDSTETTTNHFRGNDTRTSTKPRSLTDPSDKHN